MRQIRVLLVDDSPTFRAAAAGFLSRDARIQVVGQAGDGQDGVRQAQELRPDLVLMDLAMPVMNGFEATRRIKERGEAPCVLIASLHDDAESRSGSRDAGADGFLSKSDLGQGLPAFLEDHFFKETRHANT